MSCSRNHVESQGAGQIIFQATWPHPVTDRPSASIHLLLSQSQAHGRALSIVPPFPVSQIHA